ncbi:sugar ABC transporter substrate-binding protein [Nitrincola sp.]|uniref:sugar ABC transporter substrate-binding protein n=1 Tax=Nitrincola sp. TaxID=1926584 RepID=UPI003A8CFB39
MSFMKKFVEESKLSRRDFLLKTSLGIGGVAAASMIGPAGMAMASTTPTLAWGYRTPDNPYWNSIASGGENFAKSVGLDMTHLIHGGNNEKILADVKALLSKTRGNLALSVDANDSPNARSIVQACAEKGGFVSTIWNKTDDLHPWEFGDNYVCHISWSDYKPAQEVAEILMEAIGGKGGIVGIGGIASNIPAIERKAGLLKVLENYPEVELLDWQAADWSTTKANNVMATMLTRFGDEIKGIFSSNDSMTLGILEALRAEGLAGQIPIVSFDGAADVVKLIIGGEVLCTVSTNPYWAGGIALSLAYHAAIGTYKPSAEPHEHREFLGPAILITQKDAKKWYEEQIAQIPEYDWKDFWKFSSGQISYEKL